MGGGCLVILAAHGPIASHNGNAGWGCANWPLPIGDETSLKIKASIFPGGLSPHAPLNTPLAGNDVALSIVRTNN